jgi:hypothetical protein
MSNTKKGGPAFPVCDAARIHELEGMTLRDYFAAKALQGLLAGTLKSSDTSLIARDCYAMADAMLKARES